MKSFLLVISAILLILISACNATPTPAQTPTNEPEALFKSEAASIFSYLNMEIENMEVSNKFDLYEHINGPVFQVVGVSFPIDKKDGSPIFHVETRCECAEDGPCCNSNRTLVVTLMAMDGSYSETIINSVPPVVKNMEVRTYDHANPGDVMSLPWSDVIRFLHDEINSLQLAAEVEIK